MAAGGTEPAGASRLPDAVMQGTIVQVNISPGGLPKTPISGGLITWEGLQGDRHRNLIHHGGPDKAILLISAENVDDLVARGYPLYYGALGENLTTRGIDFRKLRIGDRIRAGGALLDIKLPRVPCANLEPYGKTLRGDIYDKRVFAGDYTSPYWGMSGFYTSVVESGPVSPGDIIAVVAQLA
jgi:MOSC domain-containing protein YiiM